MSFPLQDWLQRLASRLRGPHFHTRRFALALLTGTLTVAIVAVSGVSDAVDLVLYDLRLQIRPNLSQPEVPVRIALLEPADVMNDERLRVRSVDLLMQLSKPGRAPSQRPEVVAFTTPFLDLAGNDGLSLALTQGTRTAGKVVHGFRLSERHPTTRGDELIRARGLPMPHGGETLREAEAVHAPGDPPFSSLFPAATGIGFVNLSDQIMEQGVVRTTPVVMRFKDRVYPSLGLAAVMALRNVQPSEVEIVPGKAVTLRPRGQPQLMIPIDARGETLLNFRPTLGMLKLKPWQAPFNLARQSESVLSFATPDKMLRTLQPGGRILFVGDSRLNIRTPLGVEVPEVNVQAQLATDILTGDYVRKVPVSIDLATVLALVLLLSYYLGRWDPQGTGGVWAGLVIGITHGALTIFLFRVGPWWMNLARGAEALFVTVLADGIFLHAYLEDALTRVRRELDGLEKEEAQHLTNMAREEREQAERLEKLRHEEALARTILARQEALLARAMGSRPQEVPPDPVGGLPALSVLEADEGPAAAGSQTTPALAEAAGNDATAEPQPELIREVSRRYRAQLHRQGILLERYRQLLDQVLGELAQSRSRQPAQVILPADDGIAQELVTLTGVITGDPAMLALLHQVVTRIGPNDRASAFIHGESGTGKELIARAIHAHSPRRQAPFVAINCGAFPEGLIESELFGHVRGAFSGAARDRRGAFQSAHTGVLFLDEIGDAPLSIQVKLLRTLQERTVRPVGADTDQPVDVRVIAATHRDLRQAVREGHFREDLFHRLHVIPLELPPLRARSGDVPRLCQRFLEREAKAGQQPPRSFSEGALRRLVTWPWPGNVRELENCVVALNAMADQDFIDEAMVCRFLGLPLENTPSASIQGGFSEGELRWLEVFRKHRFSIVHAIAEPDAPARNRQTGYRRLLGLCCKALYLSHWSVEDAAERLGGDQGGPAARKALAKIQTYLRTLEQALKGRDLARFEADWRRFLGEDYFYVKTALEAVQAGKVRSSGPGDEEGEE